MNARWHAALLGTAVLAIAAGCSRSDDDVQVCSMEDPKDCTTYSSMDELNREIAAEMASQRRYAEHLPFDYRDLMHALLVEYLQPSGFADVENRYFVSVFGNDIDTALTAKLHESGIDVWPSSAWTSTVDRNEQGHVVSRIKVDINSMRQFGWVTYKIGIGYYCGGLCAGGQTYTLRWDGRAWRIVDRKVHWVS